MSIRTQSRTAALSWDSLTMVPAEAQIRCRHDHIIIEPLIIDYSGLLEVVEDMRPVRGIVKAVGPGHYPKRYNHPDKHRRTKMWTSPTFQPTEVKVGDVVELGAAQETRGYNFQTFLWGDKVHVICTERDVAGVTIQPCIGGDSSCPCQDGDACHYRDARDGTRAWPLPKAVA